MASALDDADDRDEHEPGAILQARSSAGAGVAEALASVGSASPSIENSVMCTAAPNKTLTASNRPIAHAVRSVSEADNATSPLTPDQPPSQSPR
jgi:hypothetical protein